MGGIDELSMLSKDECQRKCRFYQLTAYGMLLEACRTKGILPKDLLIQMRETFRIPLCRHKAEMIRVFNDEKLAYLAERTGVPNTVDKQWAEESRRKVPLKLRGVPPNVLKRHSDEARDLYLRKCRMRAHDPELEPGYRDPLFIDLKDQLEAGRVENVIVDFIKDNDSDTESNNSQCNESFSNYTKSLSSLITQVSSIVPAPTPPPPPPASTAQPAQVIFEIDDTREIKTPSNPFIQEANVRSQPIPAPTQLPTTPSILAHSQYNAATAIIDLINRPVPMAAPYNRQPSAEAAVSTGLAAVKPMSTHVPKPASVLNNASYGGAGNQPTVTAGCTIVTTHSVQSAKTRPPPPPHQAPPVIKSSAAAGGGHAIAKPQAVFVKKSGNMNVITHSNAYHTAYQDCSILANKRKLAPSHDSPKKLKYANLEPDQKINKADNIIYIQQKPIGDDIAPKPHVKPNILLQVPSKKSVVIPHNSILKVVQPNPGRIVQAPPPTPKMVVVSGKAYPATPSIISKQPMLSRAQTPAPAAVRTPHIRRALPLQTAKPLIHAAPLRPHRMVTAPQIRTIPPIRTLPPAPVNPSTAAAAAIRNQPKIVPQNTQRIVQSHFQYSPRPASPLKVQYQTPVRGSAPIATVLRPSQRMPAVIPTAIPAPVIPASTRPKVAVTPAPKSVILSTIGTGEATKSIFQRRNRPDTYTPKQVPLYPAARPAVAPPRRPVTPSLRPATPSLRPATPSLRPATPSLRPVQPPSAVTTIPAAIARPDFGAEPNILQDIIEAAGIYPEDISPEDTSTSMLDVNHKEDAEDFQYIVNDLDSIEEKSEMIIETEHIGQSEFNQSEVYIMNSDSDGLIRISPPQQQQVTAGGDAPLKRGVVSVKMAATAVARTASVVTSVSSLSTNHYGGGGGSLNGVGTIIAAPAVIVDNSGGGGDDGRGLSLGGATNTIIIHEFNQQLFISDALSILNGVINYNSPNNPSRWFIYSMSTDTGYNDNNQPIYLNQIRSNLMDGVYRTWRHFDTDMWAIHDSVMRSNRDPMKRKDCANMFEHYKQLCGAIRPNDVLHLTQGT